MREYSRASTTTSTLVLASYIYTTCTGNSWLQLSISFSTSCVALMRARLGSRLVQGEPELDCKLEGLSRLGSSSTQVYTELEPEDLSSLKFGSLTALVIAQATVSFSKFVLPKTSSVRWD